MYVAEAPHRVAHPIMKQRWESLTFLHWSYPAETVQALLPDGLTVDRYDGKAWVALVPFRIVIALPGLPSVPWLSRLPETNVRTYVTDRAGRRGIWFFSLDADRLAAVLTAQLGYSLPYCWSDMSIKRDGDVIHYRSRRYWPAPRGAHSEVSVRIGAEVPAKEVNQLEHFLTAQWMLFSSYRRGLRYAHVFHPPWTLRRAEVLHLDDQLMEAAGLPAPQGDPLAHFAPGVPVDIALPHRVRNPEDLVNGSSS